MYTIGYFFFIVNVMYVKFMIIHLYWLTCFYAVHNIQQTVQTTVIMKFLVV